MNSSPSGREIWLAAGGGWRRSLILAGAFAAVLAVGLRVWDGAWMARPYRLLVSSAAAGNARLVEVLLRLGLDPNREVTGSALPLFAAAGAGQRHTVALLLDRGADVNHRTKLGNTALHAALNAEHLDVVGDLIARGADVEIPGEDGPPLLAAVRSCRLEAAELLIHSGANPDAPSPMGTPRHYSEQSGCGPIRAMFHDATTQKR